MEDGGEVAGGGAGEHHRNAVARQHAGAGGIIEGDQLAGISQRHHPGGGGSMVAVDPPAGRPGGLADHEDVDLSALHRGLGDLAERPASPGQRGVEQPPLLQVVGDAVDERERIGLLEIPLREGDVEEARGLDLGILGFRLNRDGDQSAREQRQLGAWRKLETGPNPGNYHEQVEADQNHPQRRVNDPEANELERFVEAGLHDGRHSAHGDVGVELPEMQELDAHHRQQRQGQQQVPAQPQEEERQQGKGEGEEQRVQRQARAPVGPVEDEGQQRR